MPPNNDIHRSVAKTPLRNCPSGDSVTIEHDPENHRSQILQKTISKVARMLEISVETIRYYERRGLIQQPAKPPQGYRQYNDDTISRIRFIKRAQALGFTLDEISTLLSLHDHPCRQVEKLAQSKLTSVQEKIQDLQSLERALTALLQQCNDNEDETRCPVLSEWIAKTS